MMQTKRIHKTRDLAAALALALVLSAVPAYADDVAFRHVTVVDVVEGRLVRDQVVRISGERIVEVKPAAGARIPKGTRVVDARGKFLIPGLWDMHSHLLGGIPPGCPELTFPLTVAHGVTGVREVAAFLDILFAWREEVEPGRMVGPRIIGTDRLIDGVPPLHPGIARARLPNTGTRSACLSPGKHGSKTRIASRCK